MFIQTEATPNPETLKFIPVKPSCRRGRLTSGTPKRPRPQPLAARLFQIDGVSGVFFASDFIAVTKETESGSI